MDGVKLDKWQRRFEQETENLQIEFDSFFMNKKLKNYYEIKVDEISQNLSLVITDNTLPKEIKEQLITLFDAIRPEDSI